MDSQAIVGVKTLDNYKEGNNSLGTAVAIAKDPDQNNILCIYTGNSSRTFMRQGVFDKLSESDADLNDFQVFYVDCNFLPSLLDDGEWNWYIKESGNSIELDNSTDLVKKITGQKEFPNKTYMRA